MSVNYRACFTYYNGSGPLRQNNLFPLADFKPKAAIGFANNENKGRFYRKSEILQKTIKRLHFECYNH